MNRTIKVKAVWEFEFDAEGYDSKFVDIAGLAKESAQRELESLLATQDIKAEDFNYIVADGTKYGAVSQLPPEEFAKWIVCPDMLDDNFVKPDDCDSRNCTECCLDYLNSPLSSETVPLSCHEEKATSDSCDCEKQPTIDVNTHKSPVKTIQQWEKKCSICKRSLVCKLKDKIHEYIYHSYLGMTDITANDISFDIECGLFAPDKKLLYNKNLFRQNKFLSCSDCSLRYLCTAQERQPEINKFTADLLSLDNNISIRVRCNNFRKGKVKKA